MCAGSLHYADCGKQCGDGQFIRCFHHCLSELNFTYFTNHR
ncbi:hypothetical protein AO372_0053 [Moraxella catarrhalis]|nr:hypothetical protein AO372_0053 [Moraxella catarrhalis]